MILSLANFVVSQYGTGVNIRFLGTDITARTRPGTTFWPGPGRPGKSHTRPGPGNAYKNFALVILILILNFFDQMVQKGLFLTNCSVSMLFHAS